MPPDLSRCRLRSRSRNAVDLTRRSLAGSQMTYWLDLFTPFTWTRFQERGAEVSGFRPRQRKAAFERVRRDDKFLCYLARLSRWCGILEASSDAFEDTTP